MRPIDSEKNGATHEVASDRSCDRYAPSMAKLILGSKPEIRLGGRGKRSLGRSAKAQVTRWTQSAQRIVKFEARSIGGDKVAIKRQSAAMSAALSSFLGWQTGISGSRYRRHHRVKASRRARVGGETG